MKIVFYDVREFETDFLYSKVSGEIEPYFVKIPLSKSLYIDDKFSDCDALSVFVSSVLDEKVLRKFPSLKYIFLRSTGYSHVDLQYCAKKDIKVFNVPNYASSTVAEYAFSLILALVKRLNQSQKAIKTGQFDVLDLLGEDLSEKTIGIIGLGAIGRKILNIAHGFNMEVLVNDIKPLGAHNFVSLDKLLEKSDYVVISCPLNEQTKGMIGKCEFDKMKRTAFLINISRGETIKVKDLYNALITKKIKGAGLDVVECEETLCALHQVCKTYKDIEEVCFKKYFFIQNLIRLPNVILTPHNAYNTKEANERILKTTLFNIKQILFENSSLKNQVLL